MSPAPVVDLPIIFTSTPFLTICFPLAGTDVIDQGAWLPAPSPSLFIWRRGCLPMPQDRYMNPPAQHLPPCLAPLLLILTQPRSYS
ncbi:Calcium-transporting ATPase 3 [Fusarium oxysporum f. sp. albedinis]|nr:Calcium-transporting ATPase 3 [Fusarium oxysporum f. sp. albedinis]